MYPSFFFARGGSREDRFPSKEIGSANSGSGGVQDDLRFRGKARGIDAARAVWPLVGGTGRKEGGKVGEGGERGGLSLPSLGEVLLARA